MNHITNVDPQELKKFSTLSSQWWDKTGPCKPLHDINPLRLAYIQQHTSLINKTVLDVGCGGGILSESLAKQGAQVTAIDMSHEVIEVAKLHLLESQTTVNYQVTDVESLAKASKQQFDIITCMELLEHVPSPQSILNACAALLKPHGYLFFSTINRNLPSYLLAIIGAEYILRLLPQGTHDYAKFIKPSELDYWARAAELTLIDLTGMVYNPFTKQYSLSANVEVNYLACYQVSSVG